MTEPIWYQNPRVLVTGWRGFFPTRDMSATERVNSLVRLFLYVSIALSLYSQKPMYLVAGMAASSIISLAYSSSSTTMNTASYGSEPVGQRPRSVAAGPQRCTRPTRENPFANMMLSDLADDPDRSAACAYDDVKDEIRQHFNDGLPRNITDVYEKENSQRQYMTMPVTRAIADTKAFAEFAYGSLGIEGCKEDPARCTGNDRAGAWAARRD
jgi:hypothetical protein